MGKKEFERKQKGTCPIVAICYDFDKTLSPDDMQAQGYIQSVGRDIKDFWQESNNLAEKNDMDQNLAYMFKMLEESEGRVLFTKKKLADYGAKVELFPGVETWLERIKKYGESKGVIVEHYIISSGLKEMIEGTSVAKNGAFEKIYASSFYYNNRGVAIWPAQVVNYTSKTQFLFRIEKGVLDINDPAVNDAFAPEELRIPFKNMVYIGDSDTDIPCMKLVTANGGHSIGIYNAKTQDKNKAYKMMRDGRINYFAPSDYSDGTELDALVKSIIDKIASDGVLESIHYKNKKENLEAEQHNSAQEQQKEDLIIKLENSSNFANTHMVIKELNAYTSWSIEQKERLFEIAVSNRQVFCILSDSDIKRFFKQLLRGMSSLSENAEEVKKAINKKE